MKQYEMTITNHNEDFVWQHREDDVRKLALRKMPDGVDAQWCLQQIEGWQLARRKLPHWADTTGLHYPPRISMEQCSSEQTACYKRELLKRLLPDGERDSMMDLTGGFGIDFSYMAPLFQKAVYVEQLPHLCEIARHNFQLLGLQQAEVANDTSEHQLSTLSSARRDACQNKNSPLSSQREAEKDFSLFTFHFSLLYLDPARRDDVGRKVVALEDCSPNVMELQDELKRHARYVIVKLSPMLDITQALRQLHGVTEVHVVSVQGECKELLLVMDAKADMVVPTYYCAHIKDGETSVFVAEGRSAGMSREYKPESMMPVAGQYLYEPNASVLKAGVQDALVDHYPVTKVQLQSNLFVSETSLNEFPGRQFRIVSVGDFSKRGLKEQLKDVKQANLTIRNFPTSVAVLRKQLKLKEGGDVYLFATTLADGTHALIRCERI